MSRGREAQGDRNLVAALALVVAMTVVQGGCSTGSSGRVEGGAPAGESQRGPDVYDVIKMCRFSDEEGPVYFAHGLHAGLTDDSGSTIACVRCHHELAKEPARTPRACDKCHLSHDHYEARDIHST